MSVPLGGYDVANFYQYFVVTTERLFMPVEQATWVTCWDLTNDLDMARQIAMTWVVCGWSSKLIDLTIPPINPGQPDNETDPTVIRYNNLDSLPTEAGIVQYSYHTTPLMPPPDLEMPSFYQWLQTTFPQPTNLRVTPRDADPFAFADITGW